MGFRRYVLSRLALAIPMLLLLLTVIFVVMNIVPGDPIRAIYGHAVSEDFVLTMRHKLGLDRPLYVQYIDYMTNLFQGNLGTSIYSNMPVAKEISYALPATLELTILGMALSIAVGLPLGVVCALKKDKVSDYVIRFMSLAGYSLPVFLMGQILQYAFGVRFPLLPVQGRYNPRLELPSITHFATLDSLFTMNFGLFVDVLAHLILPSVTLAIYGSAVISRISRANMIETLGEDHISMARAKGLSERVIIYKHALRSALLPVVTIIGLWFAVLLGGAVVVEVVFAYPGMGKLLVDSIFRRDYLVIQGCMIVYALAITIISTIVDVVYAYLDPRVRY